MKTIIHVNQYIIKANRKRGTRLPSTQVLSKKLEHSIKWIRERSRLSEETKQKNIELLKASVNP
jgi:hypothetical protein